MQKEQSEKAKANERIKELNDKLNNANFKYDEQNKYTAKLEGINSKNNDLINRQMKSYSLLEDQLKERNKFNNELESKRNALSEKLESTKRELIYASAASDDLKAKLKQSNNEKTQEINKSQRLEKIVDEQKKSKSELESKLYDARNSYDALKTKLFAENKSNVDLQTKLYEANKSNDNFKTRLNQLGNTNEQLSYTNSQLEKKLNEANKSNSDLRSRMYDANETISDLKSNISGLNKTINELENKNYETNKKLAIKSDELSSVIYHRNQLSNDLQQSNNEKNHALQKINEYKGAANQAFSNCQNICNILNNMNFQWPECTHPVKNGKHITVFAYGAVSAFVNVLKDHRNSAVNELGNCMNQLNGWR